MLNRLLTLMAGWVLVVSLLFSPGMLPAERPSHLYLNLIPLCFGCSMISMKGFGVATWKRKGKRKRELTAVCREYKKTQRLDDETPASCAALLESVRRHKNNSVSIFTNPCGHPCAACAPYQY